MSIALVCNIIATCVQNTRGSSPTKIWYSGYHNVLARHTDWL